ncbi:MAG: 3-hydroxyacyl-CoA dehydrogenase family protein, partial [Pseudomonadota bacterium]
EATSPETEASAFAFASGIRKKPVFSENAPGFIANRILGAYRRAADYLLEDGASPYAIDAAMQAFGFKMGPYETLDLAGLDISWAARRRAAAAEDGARYVRIADAFCEAGRLGQKTGKGFYDYSSGGVAREDPVALALIDAERAKTGRRLRRISVKEIVDDCLKAMVNEGARVLDDGIALRPGDIDAVMVLGLGFPRHRGGPMKAGELSGLLGILRSLEARASDDPFWSPAQALRDAVKNGNRFAP